MKQFKKRTIALVLASVITVVGAFGSNNYKNSLMALNLESLSDNSVELRVQTRSAYNGNVTPIRKDINTYVLILPETDSKASVPDLQNVSSNIAGVDISTMPYSNTAKGYTRITIKTLNPSLNLSAVNDIFIGTVLQERPALPDQQEPNLNTVQFPAHPSTPPAISRVEEQVRVVSEEPENEEVEQTQNAPETNSGDETVTPTAKTELVTQNSNTSQTNNSIWLLWSILIVLISAFLYLRAKNKVDELSGNSMDLNTNDKYSSTRKSLREIKNTINTLDSAYTSTSAIISNSKQQVSSTNKPVEELNVVDLDELFQKQKSEQITSDKDDENENDALEEFLSGFSFDDEHEENIETPPQHAFDEEYYAKVINNPKILFSKEDLVRITKLLETEVSDDAKQFVKQNSVTNPIVKQSSKQEILENLVTEYAVSQRISFTAEDISALYKLISVELDNDFITDLHTNPQRTIQMEQDILKHNEELKKPSEIITLQVKNMLPDLSEALKQQGNKKIESNYKSNIVYYSEGYEVSKLTLTDTLPDLSVEINKQESYKTKPSADIQYVDTSYQVGVGELKISSELPDMQDVVANPEKYADPEPEPIVVDEQTLLNNITNVQFKPFYDGTNEFEVINDFEEAPTVTDIKEEFKQFEGFEISDEEKIEKNNLNDDYDDFQSLYSNEYFDLDAAKESEKNQSEPKKQNVSDKKPQKSLNSQQKAEPKSIMQNQPTRAEELIRKIEFEKSNQAADKSKIPSPVRNRYGNTGSTLPKPPEDIERIKCILNGVVHNVVSSVVLEDNKGCYLAKNDSGYAVLGYIGDTLFQIKTFETLKSEKIQARATEKTEDGSSRYIIRIGVQKFVVIVGTNTINYVMDL